ncbi:MAG TPA: adenylate/guanylate cyclase domain-containing protein [Actinomycetota bacterium]|jgi:predicted ATPase/class 3 adenylate cyclase|nr:adenylate/guanylate cyclase domain-containing protein [Actinomycetota bacterium]
MAELPSGTVTFLFTDIERSTQTVEAVGNEAYADFLDTHRQLLREAFKLHGGHEIGTEGDSFFVAFPRAHEALQAAIDGQHKLDDHPLRVRMGIHTGEALVRSGEYVGHDVHKAKRVCDAGHGGQVLVSRTTADLIHDGPELLDLGPHRLKDLGEPEQIFQVGPGEFPPLRSLEAFAHNLPQQRTTFIGRERELKELRELLSEQRLVTLTGVGGSGKTRLALQAGAEVLDRYPDGVFFVDLAPVTEPSLVMQAIASEIVSREPRDALAAAADSAETVLGFLARRKCLVILDNCEHLLDGCADAADLILARCPDVSVLATSREALAIEGEQTWQVPSLSVPDDSHDLSSSEAVSLFKARAKSVRSDFEITPSNAGAVAEICRRLDGMPLALEFAAARIAHLPPQEIASRLDDMFRLLTGGRRRVQRQQTLQAALDWSYDLLPSAEQVLLRRLAVFTGRFPLAAVEEICASDELAPSSVLDLLGSLVAKSLVVNEDHEGKAWYRLIEPVRLYGSEKLREAGEADSFRSRHRDRYLRWLKSFTWEQLYLSDAVGLALVDERGNLFAALEWSETEGRLDLVASMAARLAPPWLENWQRDVAGSVLAKLHVDDLATLELSVDERVACLNIAAPLGPDNSLALFDRAVDEAGGEPCSPLIAVLGPRAFRRSVLSQWMRDVSLADAARRDIEHARDIARSLGIGDTWEPRLLMWSGVVELTLGDVRAAVDLLAHGADMDSDFFAGWFQDLAAAAHVAGDHERALAAAERYLAGAHRWEQRSRVFGSWIMTPAVAIAGSGDIPRGKAMLRENFEETRRLGVAQLCEMITGAAAIAHLSGDAIRASNLLAWVRSRTIGAGVLPPSLMAFAIYRHYVAVVREALGAEQAALCREKGAAMSEDEAVACALEVLSA